MGGTARVWRLRATKKNVQMATANANVMPAPPGTRVSVSMIAPIAAAQGIVSSQAITMFPATPQRTAEKRWVAPAPRTEPEIEWVVDTG